MRLFETDPHPCGYFDERTARNVVLDPTAAQPNRNYAMALQHGFRRAGDHVYRPHCNGCRACVPCRVSVAHFQPSRSQRRCAQTNADLSMRITPAAYTDERHALYLGYLRHRHRDGGMDQASATDFERFLTSSWSQTLFLEFRAGDHLLAVAVTDVCPQALSAVYTFFDPAHVSRGLGTLAVLKQIEFARQRGLAHVYLGFWINGHPKMEYKARFRPLEVLGEHGWQTYCR